MREEVAIEIFERPSWDEWALAIAEVVATRADCTRSQVGAVILSRTHRVLAVGYNGLPAGLPGCATAGNCPRGRLSREECAPDSNYANCPAVHAEANAIFHADPVELPESTLYVTRKPCPACSTLIESAGIRRVVVRGEENTECSPLEGLWRSMQSRAASFRV
ncbi:dCMP deaminase [Streptomyces phage Lannister]|uniref:Deoxycytidylate deaminase n=1 Tax=Streptomyces phage Lannister TaxID=1674927 RepID=A0A0K1Y9Z1_9CAUD|nr:dCMP deaminase [Streptomyces phage Lannister]AKY03718.1 deoxycytidylate deaminase [Streptomyces phage Lannister]